MILHIKCSFLYHINGEIISNGLIDQKTINPHDFCYHCSKYGPACFFENLRISNFRYEPYFPAKRKLLSCQIKMKTMFKKNNAIKKRKYNMNIHKDMIIKDGVYQNNNDLFVTIHPKTHLNWNCLIIYGCHLLINHSQKL